MTAVTEGARSANISPTSSPTEPQPDELSALTLQDVDGWPLAFQAGESEPRIRDLDLAERLGYDRPRDIRKLIARLHADGKIAAIYVRATVARTSMPRGGHRQATNPEYWLTEAQALKVAARSETDPADALLDEMIRVFMLARRGALDLASERAAAALPFALPGRRASVLVPLAESMRAALEVDDLEAALVTHGAIGALLARGDEPRPADPAAELRQRVLVFLVNENTAGRGPTLEAVRGALAAPEGDVAGALHDLITRRIVDVKGTDSPEFWATSSRKGGRNGHLQ